MTVIETVTLSYCIIVIISNMSNTPLTQKTDHEKMFKTLRLNENYITL